MQGNAITWTVTKQSDGYYTLQTADGKALTVENGTGDDGNNFMLSTLTGDISQKFSFVHSADGSFALLSAASGGKSGADVFEISMESGANICQWSYWGGAGQRFVMIPTKTDAKQVLGDVDANGSFQMSDIVMMAKYLTVQGTLADWTAGDFDADGTITTVDFTLMRRYMLAQ